MVEKNKCPECGGEMKDISLLHFDGLPCSPSVSPSLPIGSMCKDCGHIERNKRIMVIALPVPPEPTDAYGYKKLFRALNKWARCPQCDAFLEWKDEKTFVCPQCGFEKPASPAPKWP